MQLESAFVAATVASSSASATAHRVVGSACTICKAYFESQHVVRVQSSLIQTSKEAQFENMCSGKWAELWSEFLESTVPPVICVCVKARALARHPTELSSER